MRTQKEREEREKKEWVPNMIYSLFKNTLPKKITGVTGNLVWEIYKRNKAVSAQDGSREDIALSSFFFKPYQSKSDAFQRASALVIAPLYALGIGAILVLASMAAIIMALITAAMALVGKASWDDLSNFIKSSLFLLLAAIAIVTVVAGSAFFIETVDLIGSAIKSCFPKKKKEENEKEVIVIDLEEDSDKTTTEKDNYESKVEINNENINYV